MKAALISMGSKSSVWTAKAMKKYFDSVDHLNINRVEVNLDTGKLDVLYDGEKIKKYDCVYVKGSNKYQLLLKSLTLALQDDAYVPFSPDAFIIGNDKLLTQINLQKENVPMPKAYIVSTEDQARKVLDKVHYPIIMKFPQGTHGKGVMYAESFAVAASLLDALTTLKQSFIIQEYIETGSTDIRAIVTGDKIAAAMKRKAVQGEKRANIHMGGKGEAFVLDIASKNVAVKAARVIGADICAVDMLESAKGPVVIEVNLSPGLQGITEATKIDVADKIAKYLYDKTLEFTNKKKSKGAKKIMEDLDIEPRKVNEIISTVEFRGNRILLPEGATIISKIKEDDEITVDADKHTILIKKLSFGDNEEE